MPPSEQYQRIRVVCRVSERASGSAADRRAETPRAAGERVRALSETPQRLRESGPDRDERETLRERAVTSQKPKPRYTAEREVK